MCMNNLLWCVAAKAALTANSLSTVKPCRLFTHLHVVLPTPPLPPTKIHLSDFCSMIFFKVGSKGSTSGASSNSSSTDAAILLSSQSEYTKAAAAHSAILAPQRQKQRTGMDRHQIQNGQGRVNSYERKCADYADDSAGLDQLISLNKNVPEVIVQIYFLFV